MYTFPFGGKNHTTEMIFQRGVYTSKSPLLLAPGRGDLRGTGLGSALGSSHGKSAGLAGTRFPLCHIERDRSCCPERLGELSGAT